MSRKEFFWEFEEDFAGRFNQNPRMLTTGMAHKEFGESWEGSIDRAVKRGLLEEVWAVEDADEGLVELERSEDGRLWNPETGWEIESGFRFWRGTEKLGLLIRSPLQRLQSSMQQAIKASNESSLPPNLQADIRRWWENGRNFLEVLLEANRDLATVSVRDLLEAVKEGLK